MTEPSYPAPPIHRASLEQRLRNICGSLGINELRTRTSLAHTVVAQMLPAGVVKGGAAINSASAIGPVGSPPTSTQRVPPPTPSRPTPQNCRTGSLKGGTASPDDSSTASPPIRRTCPLST